MTITAIVGTQWGDEGKGRMTDLLATNADAVIRFQGGANAGHTVINAKGKFALHLIPSGIFNKKALNILGPGVIVEPNEFLEELKYLKEKVNNNELGKIVISDRAHLGLPVYKRIESLLDSSSGLVKYGSTRRGIAQAYMFKAAKVGLQVGDLLGDKAYLYERVKNTINFANYFLQGLGEEKENIEDVINYLEPLIPKLKPYVTNIFSIIKNLEENGKDILIEGQLGTLRDLDWGIYPFTTSSNPIAGYASVGAGIQPKKITNVIGLMKAYSTCVGTGPFVTELLDSFGDKIRDVGKEYGASTGRPRRIGWFDLVASRYGAYVQGATKICITMLDVLSCVESIKICTHYLIDGKKTSEFPLNYGLRKAKPVLKEFKGWEGTSINHIRNFEDLPNEAKAYISYIEQEIQIPVSYISVGPKREDIIYRY